MLVIILTNKKAILQFMKLTQQLNLQQNLKIDFNIDGSDDESFDKRDNNLSKTTN